MLLPLAYGISVAGEEHYGTLDNDGYFSLDDQPRFLPRKEVELLGNGLALLKPCSATILDNGKEIGWLEVDVLDGRIVCTSIEAFDGYELTGQLLRQIPIATLVKEVAQSQLVHVRDGFVVKFVAGLQGDFLPGTRKRRTIDRAFLQKVADIYRQAVASGISTQDSVQRHLGPISDSGARRWILQARKAGFLGPALGPWQAGEASPHSHPAAPALQVSSPHSHLTVRQS